MVTTRIRRDDGTVVEYSHPYSRALECIETRVEETLKAALMRIAKSIDPNWLQLEVELRTKRASTNGQRVLDRGLISEFDFRPCKAVLNGPKGGDIDFLSSPELLREDVRTLCALHCLSVSLGSGNSRLTAFNDRHQLELIVGRTLLHDDFDSHLVTAVEGERFTCRSLGHGCPTPYSSEWTLSGLLESLNASDIERESMSHLGIHGVSYRSFRE